jgi:16S rRNA (cytidine1402-2'-O)-methyltransferase
MNKSAFTGTLSVMATPIGNLGDWSYRAVETAKTADLIACEDTRISRRLLHHYGIHTQLFAYHEHNAARQRPVIIEKLLQGQHVVLISDAGTPLISDPGYKLVEEAQQAGIPVVSVPGPSSVTAALSICGLPSDRFLFLGFPPPKTKARKALLQEYATVKATLVLLESPQRITDCLADAAEILGNRHAAVCRELTKKFEEVRRGSLEELHTSMAETQVKGEIVLVIAPPSDQEIVVDEATIDAMLLNALKEGSSTKQAATDIAALTPYSTKELYARIVQLKKSDP